MTSLTSFTFKMHFFIGFLVTALFADRSEAKVLELSDRFIPLRHEGMWLIKFYAPWCGHCKKLEPVWKHVEQSLNSVPIRVARIDCTRFPAVNAEFNIVGYPTILFLKGKLTFTYEGDRNRDDIVSFAKRLLGPPVGELRTKGDFEEAGTKSEIFFLFSGEQDGPLWETFYDVASKYQQHEFFYHASPELAEKFSGVRETQTIRVYKDGTSFKFEDFEAEFESENPDRVHRSLSDSGHISEQDMEAAEKLEQESKTNTTLSHWINRERFPKFVKVTRSKFSHLLHTKKLVVIAVLDENRIGQISPEMEEFKNLLIQVMEKNLDRYRDHFQFGWTGSPDLANSVAMETLSLPHLLVVNTTSYQHFLPDDDPNQLTAEAMTLFLDDVLAGNAPVYGGSSYTVRLYRAYYEAKSSIYDMWQGNPALTAVLFGLPIGFLSLICYSICCADIMDAEEDDEEETEDWHEKTD